LGIGSLQRIFESLDVNGNLFSGFNAFFNGVGGDVLVVLVDDFRDFGHINEVVFEVNSFELFGVEDGAEVFNFIEISKEFSDSLGEFDGVFNGSFILDFFG